MKKKKPDKLTRLMQAHFENWPHSFYKIAMDVGIDPSNSKKILYKERPTTFEARLEIIKKISKSELLGLDLGTMAQWLGDSYLAPEVLNISKDAAENHLNEIQQ